MIQDMLTCAIAPNHGKVVDGFNARTDTREQTCRTCGRLSQQDGVANTLLLNLLLNRLGQTFDKLPLHILVSIELGEGTFLGSDICRSLVGSVSDGSINMLNDWERS